MRFLALPFLIALVLFSCQNTTNPYHDWDIFGDAFTPESPIPVAMALEDFVLDEEKSVEIIGELTTVCQTKGCWTILETEDGRSLRMTFYNYSYFLPLDAAGRTVIAKGVGLKKETSVAELRHYAEDAHKSEEEILAITEPRIEYLFEARGVLMKPQSL